MNLLTSALCLPVLYAACLIDLARGGIVWPLGWTGQDFA